MKDVKDQEERRESGQVLVTVALLMVPLLLFLALAVDVSHIYQRRRFMQNAADAGALAGARELCFGDPGLAEYVAQDYAERNGAQTVDVTIGDGTVNVVASEVANTIFAGIVGMNTADVGAEAEALCGSAKSVCGLWPIALVEWRWDELKTPCVEGREFYVWSGDNPNKQPDCTIYDCDVDHDLTQDVPNDIVDMMQRAWLDFSDVMTAEYPDDCVAPGCGTDEIVCWILNNSGAQLTIGDCVAGDTGLRAAIDKPVDSRATDIIALPTYTQTNCTGVTCPGSSIRVSGWACIEVVEWVSHLELPRHDGELPPWKGPVIKVKVTCDDCVTYCGASTPGPAPPGGVQAVSLTK